jgi:alpha-D-ribose 1-methylphosphonate 5-phosphate C-P lyase
MELTKEQKEIFSKIADIKQVILKNHFDISDLTEQLISTLPFKEGDIVLYYKDEPYMVSKIEPWDEGIDTSHTYRYYGNIHLVLNKICKNGNPSRRNQDKWLLPSIDIEKFELAEDGKTVRL